jgi:hypothetical protein
LALGVPWLLLGRRAWAFGDTSKLVFGQIRHAGVFNPRPHALRRLSWELIERTSLEVVPQVELLSLSDREVFQHPFLYLAGEGGFAIPNEAEVRALRRFLTYGGFLLIDSADGSAAFDASVRQLMTHALPDAPLERIPSSHVLYKSFYLVDHQGGRQIVKPFLEGAAIGGRLAVVYSQNDLGGAWARDDRGEWEFDTSPGGELQRETAFRIGVNLAMYATCLDYKDDQVHLPFIMKRRR